MAGSQQDEMNLQEIEDEIIVEEAVQEIIDYIVENDVTSDTDEESTTTCNLSGQCSINFGFNTYYAVNRYVHSPSREPPASFAVSKNMFSHRETHVTDGRLSIIDRL